MHIKKVIDTMCYIKCHYRGLQEFDFFLATVPANIDMIEDSTVSISSTSLDHFPLLDMSLMNNTKV